MDWPYALPMALYLGVNSWIAAWLVQTTAAKIRQPITIAGWVMGILAAGTPVLAYLIASSYLTQRPRRTRLKSYQRW